MENEDEFQRLNKNASEDEEEDAPPDKNHDENSDKDDIDKPDGLIKSHSEECKIEMDHVSPKRPKLKRQSTRREFFLPLHQAVRNGNLEALQCFLSNMTKTAIRRTINSLDDKKMTPLHYAARYNHINVAKLLLDYGAEIDSKGEDGVLPLHVASRYRRLSAFSTTDETDAPYKTVIGLLVSRGACINCKDKYGMTPLHYAAMRGNEMAARELLQNPDINIEVFDKQCMTPMHLATNYGNFNIVRLLIEAGCHLICCDEQLQTPLHKAAAEGHDDIVKLLIKVVEEESANAVKEMIAEKDQDDNTALHLAVEKGHFNVTKTLLENGADVNTPGEFSVYPLHLASTIGNLDIVQLLIEYKALVNCLNYQQETPLHKAAAFNHKDVIEFLIKHGALIDCRCINHFTPLLLAAREGHIDAIKALLDNNADVSVVDKNEKSVVYWLCERNHPEALEILLKECFAPNLIFKEDAFDNNPLHVAAENGYADVLKILLENGADIHSKNEDGETAMHLAAKSGHRNIVKLLLETSKSIVNAEDEEKNTPLHVAALKGHQRVVKDLIVAGANVESRNCNLWTALDCAAYGGWLKTALILLKAGSPIDPLDKAKTTPLHLAASRGHAKVVEMLLHFGAKIGQLDAEHNNCLDIAIRTNQREVALKIINNKNWKEALRNSTDSRKYGIHQTPLRKLIRQMPDVAEIVFNKFITDNGYSSEHPKFNKYYNYEFLDDMFVAPSYFEDQGSKEFLFDSSDIYDEHDKVKITSVLYTLDKEILKQNHPLMLMVTAERQQLLGHPICTSLLNYKWRIYGRYVYYTNLLVYILFLIFFTGYVLCNHPPCPEFTDNRITKCCMIGNATDCPLALGNCKSHENFFEYMSTSALYALTIVHLLKELFQLKQKKLQYFTLVNILEWCCYVSALLFTINFTQCSKITGIRTYWQWQMGGISIFLAWMVLVLFVRKFHLVGIYIVMFTDILTTFAQFFIVFFLFIIAFSLGFYTLIQNQNPFESPGESLLKTSVMMIGEFEYDAIFNDPENPIYFKGPTYILFIIFLILMSIIIMNLLVGLAVDDIKGVQEQAELKRLAMKVDLVLSVEHVLPHWALRKCTVRMRSHSPNVKNMYQRIISYIWPKPNVSPAQHYFKTEMDRVQEKQDVISRKVEVLQAQLQHLKRQNKEILSILADMSKQSEDDDIDDDDYL
nr:sTRP5 [Mesobuthus martensii]